MYVKKIIIQGFKSFAHLTTIELSPGLNAVVGPNGSGKSNLIDALRWVWGDKTRELRVTQNRQVIFHGSRTVKPLGMADIEVWWEDSSGAILKVGRRIFASGESEYFFQDEKVRWREWRESLEKKGLGVERLTAGIIGTGELQALLYETPLERWQWLETISGTGTWKRQLSQVSLRLEKIESRKKLLEERLKELSLQVEKWKLWAQEEEEYLSLEKEWKEAKALYIQEMIKLHKQKINLLKKEREIEEEQVKEREKEKRKWEDISFLSLARDKYQREKKDIEKEIAEKEKEKKKAEEKLYYLLTEARESKKASLRIKEKLPRWEEAMKLIEEKWRKGEVDSSFSQKEIRRESEEELKLQLQEKESTLREWEKSKIHLEERKNHEKIDKKKLENRLQSELNQRKVIEEEVRKLQAKIKEGEEEIKEGENKIEKKKEEEKALKEKWEKGQIILHAIAQKINTRRKREKETYGWEKELNIQGWSRRAIQAIAWFWENQNLKDEDFDMEQLSERVGQWWVSPSIVPPAFWRECQKKEVLYFFESGKLPEENLIASDGSLIFLRSGFLLFPGQLVSSPGETRFYPSWKKREKKWQDKVTFWENRMRDISKEEKNEEEKLWKKKIEIEKEREKLIYREKGKEERDRTIEQLKKEIELITEKETAEEQELNIIIEKMAKTREDISQIRRSLTEIEKEKKKIAEREKEREKLRWEIQSLKKDIEEGLEILKREEEAKRKYAEKLREEGSKIWAIENAIAEKRSEGKRVEKEERNINEKIDLARKKVQEIEREIGEREKKIERTILLEEKLNAEAQELYREEEKWKSFYSVSPPSVDIKKLERSVQEKEKLLQEKRFIPGAGEEFARVQERFSSLKEKGELCEVGLSLVREGVSLAQREIKKNFQEFLYQVNKNFSTFFTEIFPTGEARLLFQEERAEIEVRLPGKRKQNLSLLSSGEKSLVALCFLFAVFESAQLPFCFLDEVDANLDHTNSLLLAQLLKNISRSRQVVVVTHQEEVMEAADQIIGMTMNDPGVSQAVCLDGKSFQ